MVHKYIADGLFFLRRTYVREQPDEEISLRRCLWELELISVSCLFREYFPDEARHMEIQAILENANQYLRLHD